MSKHRFVIEVEFAEAEVDEHNDSASFPIPTDPDLWGVGDLTELIDNELGTVEIVSFEALDQ